MKLYHGRGEVVNEMQIFNNPEFGQIRTVDYNGEPWFVAVDICRALDIKNSRNALTRLDEDEKGVVLTDTLGGRQEVAAVNEYGLYNIVLSSRKPEVKAFKRWITHDVIPAIRKTGKYALNTEPYDPDKLTYNQLSEIATILKGCPKYKLPLICQLFQIPLIESSLSFQNQTIDDFMTEFLQQYKQNLIMKQVLYGHYLHYCRKHKVSGVTDRSFSRYITGNYNVDIVQRRMGFMRERFYKFNE